MKKISFSDVCDLTACVLRGEVTNKVMPVTMTLHVGLSGGDLKKIGPDDMTFYFNKEDVLCVEYEGKHYKVPKQSQPTYTVGEKVAISQCLKDLGYDPEDRSDGHVRGLKYTLAWTMKSHVSASQCKNFVKITGRQVKRLQDITDEEILHSGVYRWGDMPDCPSKDDFSKNLYGVYKFWDGYLTAQEAYYFMIDKIQKKGFWESNPWVIIYKFELTKEITEKSEKLKSEVKTKFDEGWWNCFCSFANELANVSSSASMVIRNVLDGAGVTKKEITDNLKIHHFEKRVAEELKEYKSKL